MFDRGYPSEDMFHFLNSPGILFLMCISKTFKKAISKEQDSLFKYLASKDKNLLILESIHFLLDDGTTEYIVTNLMSSQMELEKFSKLKFYKGLNKKRKRLLK